MENSVMSKFMIKITDFKWSEKKNHLQSPHLPFGIILNDNKCN